MPKPIDSFSDEYFWLDNFYIEPDGTHVEGEFQRMKCRNPLDRQLFVKLGPGEAKSLGNSIALRTDWEQIKFTVMVRAVRQKFHDHPVLGAKLVNTGVAYLIESNTWNDRCWGVCRGKGTNWLGHCLMIVRAELQAEVAGGVELDNIRPWWRVGEET